jgi:hypothetical protein
MKTGAGSSALLVPGLRRDDVWIPPFVGMTFVVDFRLFYEGIIYGKGI